VRVVHVAVALAAGCATQSDSPSQRPHGLSPAMIALRGGDPQATSGWEPRVGTPGTPVMELIPPPAARDVAAPGEHDGHLFLSAPDAWALLAIDPTVRPHLLRVPPALGRPGTRMWGIFRLCVLAEGGVSTVDVRKSAVKLVDGDWVQALLTWRFRPLVREGKAVPFCTDAPLSVTVK
jgi:hypothetical protein